jgi:flavin-binding protein dodecin
MPSITLKGVSIKGTSKVTYEEAAAAAQSDAQSALSQEKVPRAYQGAVKDYFDDLKKQ